MVNDTIKVLVTGAAGFVGKALLQQLILDKKYLVSALIRHKHIVLPSEVKVHEIRDWMDNKNLRDVLSGVDVIVHLAARAHIVRDKAPNPLAEFRKVNVEGTLNLARQAAAAQVKRFIFISSVGVNGAFTHGRPFNEDMPPDPHSCYAIAKLEAEEALQLLCQETGMEMVIIRPPLVYADEAPGNFARLLKIVSRGFPLPLYLVRNKRSFVARENLVDFIIRCIVKESAANQIFLIADGVDFSTPQLIHLMAEGMGRPVRLLPVPVSILAFGANVLGMQSTYRQLCDSLQVDITKARTLLGWEPPVPPEKALQRAARDYFLMNKLTYNSLKKE